MAELEVQLQHGLGVTEYKTKNTSQDSLLTG
jgi:hypothetical protein